MAILNRKFVHDYKMNPKAIIGLIIAMLGLVSLFQNCGKFTASNPSMVSMASFDFTKPCSAIVPDTSSKSWAAARILTGIPYSNPESVYTYPNYSWSRPVLDKATGRITYIGYFADRSWQLVSQSTSGVRTKHLTSANSPGYRILGFETVPEASLILVLLDSQVTSLKAKLLAIPQDGSKSWTIATDVLTAEISLDGKRVNYTAGSNSTGFKIFTTPIVSPNPVELGAIIPPSYIHSGGDIWRSTSSASNIPRFYLINSQHPNNGPYIATLFGDSSGTSLPPTFDLMTDFTGVGHFERFGWSTGGKMVLAYSSGHSFAFSFVDATGVKHASEAILSPDGTKVASFADDGTAAIYNDDGTVISISNLKNVVVGPWSSDSRYVIYYLSATEWRRVDSQTGDVVNGKRLPSDVETSERPIGLIGNGNYVLTRTNTYTAAKLKVVSIDGSASVTLTIGHDFSDTIGPNNFVDTGDGVIFNDDWGLYFTHYDGSGRVRLDNPNPDEFALPDNYHLANPMGSLYWDAARSRVIYEPVISPKAATSSGVAIHNLATRTLNGTSATLTTDTKRFSQIGGFWWNYDVNEEYNLVMFNSFDGTETAQVLPSILSAGCINGSTAGRVSPPSLSGLGSGYFKPILNRVGDLITYFYSFFTDGGFILEQSNGLSSFSYDGFDLHLISPDHKWLFLTANGKAYLKRADTFTNEAPVLISDTLIPQNRSSCFGCGGLGWTYSDGSGSFTSNSKLILTASADSRTTFSSYLIDPLDLSAAPIALGFETYSLLADGKTMISQLPDSTLVMVSSEKPTEQKILLKANLLSIAGRTLLVNNNGAGNLFAYNLDSSMMTNLIPTTLPAGSYTGSGSLSTDGSYASFLYRATNTTDPYACENYFELIVGTDGVLKNTIQGVGDCSNINTIQMSADKKSLFFVQDGRIMRETETDGWVPLAVSPVTLSISYFFIAERHIFSISTEGGLSQEVSVSNLDGSGRRVLGSPLPLSKTISDIRFIRGEKSVLFLTDAAEDGVVALTRFDIEL